MEKGTKIVFMGTPGFAVASLGSLLMNGYDIVGVVTSPDKPAGRGRKIKRSPVAEYATDNYLNLLQPHNLKDPSFINDLKKLKPDIAVVVAFRMLPEEVWKIPSLGTFNLHASLLPQYRGAAPINWAIINGETRTGITTFLIDDKIDTGNILLRREISINHTDSAGELHDRLMRSGAKLVTSTVKLIASGKAVGENQDQFLEGGENLKTAPKIFASDCFINWDKDTEVVYNFIRGLSPHPGARTILKTGEKETLLKILESKPYKSDHNNSPGDLLTGKNRSLIIYTGDGYIDALKVHPEGKKVMTGVEYVRGLTDERSACLKGPQV